MTDPLRSIWDYEAPQEEKRILLRWAHVFLALERGDRQPETDRQRLFVDEVRGTVYPVSVSAKVWIRYRDWLKDRETREREAWKPLAKTPEPPAALFQADDDRERFLRTQTEEAEYRAWLKEHEFDDFR